MGSYRNGGNPAQSAIHTLADLPIPVILDSQVGEFTTAALHASRTRSFDPRSVLAALSTSADSKVTAVDVGGDKLVACRYVTQDGGLQSDGPPVISDRGGGTGYLELLEDVTAAACAAGMPIGVSYAGPVNGSRVLAGVNVPEFVRDLMARYDGDFQRIDATITVVNDAEAGLLAASVEAFRRYPQARTVIYVITGSGIGCAVLHRDEIITTEAGHIRADDDLNVLAQNSQCGMFGASYVCLERIGASKAGIEDIWLQRTRTPRTGKEIAEAYLAGDDLALRLYDTSALAVAHVVRGVAEALGLTDDWGSIVVAGHGGTFHVRGYSDRVRSILETDLQREIRLLLTKDFSANACLDGAAIAGMRWHGMANTRTRHHDAG